MTALKVLAVATRAGRSATATTSPCVAAGPSVRRMLHLSHLIRVVEVDRARLDRCATVASASCRITPHGRLLLAVAPAYPRSMTEKDRPAKDRPWVMRTYAGHSTAAASNALYRTNLAKGQTGLSVAFDLPTQTGYDPDSPLARGEVGKVGVPVPHLGEMRKLFEDIPLTEMNTSMTINATAMWLLAMYQVVAEEQNPDARRPRRSPPSWPAPPRTTSSRSTSPAGPTCSRPSTRCG